jgi:anti-sigma factor RsiW
VTRCSDIRVLLGSHSLGGLDREDTELVERHLESCAACRSARAKLAPLPGLLDLVDADRPHDEAPSPQLERAVLSRFESERPTPARRTPRWRVALAGGLAGVAATVAVLALAGAFSADDSAEARVALSPPAGAPAAGAQARLVTTSAGTEIELDAELPQLERGELYELWCVWGDVRLSAGTFTVDADGRASVRLTTAAPAHIMDRLGITREPDGLDPARNGPVVVTGTPG